MKGKFFITLLVMGLLVGVLTTTATAAPGSDGEPDLSGRVDNRVDPLGAVQAD